MNKEFLKFCAALKGWRSQGWLVDFVYIDDAIGFAKIGLTHKKRKKFTTLVGRCTDDFFNAVLQKEEQKGQT